MNKAKGMKEKEARLLEQTEPLRNPVPTATPSEVAAAHAALAEIKKLKKKFKVASD